MPNERVLNLPLSSDEIIEILLQRFEKKLRADCFLHPANTYNGFSYTFEMKLKFADMMMGRETLVWDAHVEPKQPVPSLAELQEKWEAVKGSQPDQILVTAEERAILESLETGNEVAASETFDSGDSPNRTREEHDLPMPVETTEGKRKVIRHRKM